MGVCEGNYLYEILEFLGDSVFNFIGGVYMYIDFFFCISELFYLYCYDLVSNRNLYKCGFVCGFFGYIFVELLNIKMWVLLGLVLEDFF